MLTRSFMKLSSAPRRRLGRTAWLVSLTSLLLVGGCGDDDKKPGVDSARAGSAGAKFCNNLVTMMGPLTLTLEIGTPAVKLTAVSGKCSVDKGATCAGIPAGFHPWKLTLDGETVITGSSEIKAGEQRIFVADLDMATRRPDVIDGILQMGVQCKDFDPFEGATDPGTPMPPTGPGGRP